MSVVHALLRCGEIRESPIRLLDELLHFAGHHNLGAQQKLMFLLHVVLDVQNYFDKFLHPLEPGCAVGLAHCSSTP
jgi:hypothetical protein